MQNIFLFIRDLGSYFYFSSISLIYCLGIYWFYRRTRNLGLNVSYALDLSFIIMIFGFVGARLLHVRYEYPDYYAQNPMRILYFWHGGFVFFGGAICAFVASLVFFQIRGLLLEVWGDILLPVIVGGYGLGRIVGFLAGSSHGSPSTLPWAVVYPNGFEAPPYTPLHPVAIYEAIWTFISLAIVLKLERRKPIPIFGVGTVFYSSLLLHGIGRIAMETLRGDYRGPIVLGLSISTWVAAVICSWGLLNLVHKFKRQ